MPRRPKENNPELLRSELINLLVEFEEKLKKEDLRLKVLTLVQAFHKMRDLGSSLIPIADTGNSAAKSRILLYFRKYAGKALRSDEFLVVSGIQDYPRRIRELRIQDGWPIVSGKTAKQMAETGDLNLHDFDKLKSDDYLLLRDEQDREAAHRWYFANTIRKENSSLQAKFLKYFKNSIAKPVTGEELSYLANGASEWPRRIRELRTEEGWPIKTKNTGRPDLPVGTYIMEDDRQSEVHDRHIPDSVRVKVLERDSYQCVKCSWSQEKIKISDPRHLLELHHIQHHLHKGKNIEENLATLCNVDHDEIHRLDRRNAWTVAEFYDWVKAL